MTQETDYNLFECAYGMIVNAISMIHKKKKKNRIIFYYLRLRNNIFYVRKLSLKCARNIVKKIHL